MLRSILWTAIASVGVIVMVYSLRTSRADYKSVKMYSNNDRMIQMALLHLRTSALRLTVCSGNAALGVISLFIGRLPVSDAMLFGTGVIAWLLFGEAVLVSLSYMDQWTRRNIIHTPPLEPKLEGKVPLVEHEHS